MNREKKFPLGSYCYVKRSRVTGTASRYKGQRVRVIEYCPEPYMMMVQAEDGCLFVVLVGEYHCEVRKHAVPKRYREGTETIGARLEGLEAQARQHERDISRLMNWVNRCGFPAGLPDPPMRPRPQPQHEPGHSPGPGLPEQDSTGYVSPALTITAPQQPAEQQPYTWAPQVLDGTISIVGGRVAFNEGACTGTVVEEEYDRDGSWCVWVAWDYPTGCQQMHDLAVLRPAPHDWRVGDTALVVSMSASKGDTNTSRVNEIGRTFTVAPNTAQHVPGMVNLTYSGWYWHPADLLYIPPAEQPAPAAMPDANASGYISFGVKEDAH